MNQNGTNSKIQEEEEKKETAINLLTEVSKIVKFGEVNLTLSKYNDEIKEAKITMVAQTRF